MKILIDARMYGLENAGIGRYLINLIREFKSLKTDKEFVILLREKYYKKLHFPGNWKKILANFGHYTLEEQINLPKLIKSQNPDLVHFPHFNVPVFYRGRYVVTIHDMTMHWQGKDATKLPFPLYLAKRLPYKLVFRNAVERAAKIIVPSYSVKKNLEKYFKFVKDKIAVTYEGLDPVYKGLSMPNLNITSFNLGNNYFVYTGNAYPHKNLKAVIDATCHLNKHLAMDVKLVIIGSRTVFLERLRDYIEQVNANSSVKLMGYVEDDYLRLIYRNSLAFVFPSLSEGFGLPGIEAMASGTLLLASDIPVFREIYKNNALYFNPEDYKSIAELMKKAVKMSKPTRNNIIQKSKKFAMSYSWAKMAKETIKVYENCDSI